MNKIIVGILSCVCFCELNAQYFTKNTTSVLVQDSGDSRSVNWVDVNNDGWVDCFISNGPSEGQNNSLYINNGTGDFVKVLNDSIVMDQKPSDGATFGDADNDGDLDAFVVNWYGVNNMLYENNGNADFTKINNLIPAADGGYSETGSWGDYDKDGLLDLYVTNSAGNRKNFLYHNDGGLTFTKITVGPIVNDVFFSRCVNWTDIDNDGDLDVFVANENNNNENIYRNDGNGTFVKLTTGSLITAGGKTMSSSWADFDNDGDMDVFLANDAGFNGLYRNEGNFVFTKLSGDTVCNTPSNSFSSAWSDLDNDGDEDLFVTNSFGTNLHNNFLYINNGDGTFSRSTSDVATNEWEWSYGCAFGDYDNDGFEDLAVATCRYNGTDKVDLLYHNNGNANHWITIKLNGTVSNKAAIGARIYIKAIINGNAVWQMREISAQSSYCGQNDIRAHFGLGDATIIDSIKVIWPLGITEIYTGINTNQIISYTEGATIDLNKAVSMNNYEFFPNPTKEEITLKSKDNFNSGDKLIILSAEGKVVDRIMLQQTNHISISLKKYFLPSGLYKLLIISKNNTIVLPFIKE